MRLLEILQVIAAALLIGMSAAAVPPVLRALPFISDWTARGIKPWACDLCMSFWSTVLSTLIWSWTTGLLWFSGFGAFIVTFAIVRHNSEAIGQPPDLALLDSAEDPADRTTRPEMFDQGATS